MELDGFQSLKSQVTALGQKVHYKPQGGISNQRIIGFQSFAGLGFSSGTATQKAVADNVGLLYGNDLVEPSERLFRGRTYHRS